jgi:hypothetical protein
MNPTILSWFTDDWWMWVWKNYSMSILGFPILATFIIKLIAIYNPNIKGKEISDLFDQYWPKKKE